MSQQRPTEVLQQAGWEGPHRLRCFRRFGPGGDDGIVWRGLGRAVGLGWMPLLCAVVCRRGGWSRAVGFAARPCGMCLPLWLSLSLACLLWKKFRQPTALSFFAPLLTHSPNRRRAAHSPTVKLSVHVSLCPCPSSDALCTHAADDVLKRVPGSGGAHLELQHADRARGHWGEDVPLVCVCVCVHVTCACVCVCVWVLSVHVCVRFQCTCVCVWAWIMFVRVCVCAWVVRKAATSL